MNEIDKEIDEMDKMYDGDGVDPTEAPPTEVPASNPPPTDPPPTEAPGPTEAPATEAPVTSAPVTAVPMDEDRLKLEKENKELREKIDEMSAKPTSAPPTSPPPTEAPISDEDFLGEIDLEELTRDPKLFNVLLNNVYKKGREAARGEVRTGNENILRTMPDIVKVNLQLQQNLKTAAEEFYTANEDLRPFSKIVGEIFEEEFAKSPDKKYIEIIKDVETETRKRLDLHKKATERKPPPPPPGTKGKGRQSTKPKTDALTEEIGQMDEALNS